MSHRLQLLIKGLFLAKSVYLKTRAQTVGTNAKKGCKTKWTCQISEHKMLLHLLLSKSKIEKNWVQSQKNSTFLDFF